MNIWLYALLTMTTIQVCLSGFRPIANEYFYIATLVVKQKTY